jgi:hypothetical protein
MLIIARSAISVLMSDVGAEGREGNRKRALSLQEERQRDLTP